MNLDLRFPLGSMFVLMGMILTAFGAVTIGKDAVYANSLNVNANLCWGPVLLIFGSILLLSARRGRKRPALPLPEKVGRSRRKR